MVKPPDSKPSSTPGSLRACAQHGVPSSLLPRLTHPYSSPEEEEAIVLTIWLMMRPRSERTETQQPAADAG